VIFPGVTSALFAANGALLGADHQSLKSWDLAYPGQPLAARSGFQGRLVGVSPEGGHLITGDESTKLLYDFFRPPADVYGAPVQPLLKR
jgi:hypothetical protein